MNYVIKRDDRDQRNIHVSESCYFGVAKTRVKGQGSRVKGKGQG